MPRENTGFWVGRWGWHGDCKGLNSAVERCVFVQLTYLIGVNS
jgi:hypothetical protein